MGEESLTPHSLVPIMLRSSEGWDQLAAFVALTMSHKVKLAWERQRRSITVAIQHPVFAVSNTALKEEDNTGWPTSTSDGS